jgi:hypothetical protein
LAFGPYTVEIYEAQCRCNARFYYEIWKRLILLCFGVCTEECLFSFCWKRKYENPNGVIVFYKERKMFRNVLYTVKHVK